MAFGKEINRLRKKEKISAQRIADLLGVGVDRLRQWELRDVDPKDDRDIKNIQRKFGGMQLEQIMALESLPDFVLRPEESFEKGDATEIIIQGMIEIIASQRVILSVLAEIQAPTREEKSFATQLSNTYRKMVKDEGAEVGEEMRQKLKMKV